MRIGVDGRELAGQPTGVGRYLSELLARWTRESWAAPHELVLFTPRDIEHRRWHGSGGARCDVALVPGSGGTAWEQGTLARAIRRGALDVFFAPGYTAPLLVSVPIVASIHDVSFAAHPEWFRPREAFRQTWLTRATAHRARRVLTLTSFSRDEIVRCLRVPPSRVQVISPAVDTHPSLAASEAPRVDPCDERFREPLILYVGSIFTRRHVPELLEAFTQLAGARARLRLVMVGDDRSWPPQRIPERIAMNAAAGRIEWHRWLSDRALSELYGRAKAFAFLSEYEGFGLTPLEALRAGAVPVVADVPVAHEAYGRAALFADPADPCAIASALATALEDAPARARVLGAARDILGRYSWDRAARETMEALLAVSPVNRS